MGLQPIGRTALNSLRIEAGIPRVGPDINEGIVPPEANLEGKAFSLTKGCYPGQEVVARMDTYGSIKRRLVGLILDERENSHSLKMGRKCSLASAKSVGYRARLTRLLSTRYSRLGFPLRDFTKPDMKLTVETHNQRYPATVRSLPFLP